MDNNKIQTIVEFDFSLIADFFKYLNRQGPGSEEITLQAISYIDNFSQCSHIADLGCGTGTQTLTLARNTSAKITAIDLIPEMIEPMNITIDELQLGNQISTIVGSMGDLSFSDEELDVIWAEGSIYNIGFEDGLNYFRRFLKPGGYVAVSEATWKTKERPTEIETFWDMEYPDIDMSSVKVRQMESTGYIPIAHFMLPHNCWIDNFYALMPNVIDEFLKRHNYSKVASEFIDMMRIEIDMYNRYKEYYGYAFYIGKKY